MRVSEYLRALWPAVSSTGLMAAVVYGAHHYLYAYWPPPYRLAADILLGLLSYVVFLVALHRARIFALKDVYRLIRTK